MLLNFNTKANTLDSSSMLAIERAISIGKPIIIINDGIQFSAGVNLNYVMELAKDGEWKKIETFITDFQKTCMTIKYCKQPVISAPSGLAIGGGFEVVSQSNYCCFSYKCYIRFSRNSCRFDSCRRRM